MRTSQKGIAALAIIILQAAFLPIALQIGGQSIGIIQFIFYTSIIAAVVCLIASYLDDKWKGLSDLFRTKKTFVVATIAALLGYPITLLLFNIGVIGTNASVGVVVWRSWVLILAIMTPLALRQKVSVKSSAALAIAFVGIYIIASNGSWLNLSASELPYIIALIASGVAIAASVVVVKGHSISPTGFVAFANILAVLFMLPIIAVYHTNIIINIPAAAWLPILFMGVINSALASILFYQVFKIFKTTTVGNAMLVVPYLTIPLSYILIGTAIQGYYIIAAIVLSVAILIQQREGLHAPERIKSAHTSDRTQIFDVTSAFINNKSPIISRHISGENRALAIELDVEKAERFVDKEIQLGESLFFMHTRPHQDIRTEEIEFLKEILGLKAEHIALVGMGNPEEIETAFQKFN
ncbi:MAG: EamA family transporter [Candidatus Micrarchaeota archaeon]|nr:EamA family transporter [Planctomycetota bacterium]MDE1850167.1 EamA family transporter [Candidatus Micrarchaeota archaeon]